MANSRIYDPSIEDGELIIKQRASVWRNVVTAYQTCNAQYAKLLERFNLTIPQFDVLSAIGASGGRALPKQIAERLLVTKANITVVVAKLEERGFVSRQVHESDGRSFLLSLTREGGDITKLARQAADEFVAQQLSPFSDEDVTRVGKIMREMRQHLSDMNIEQVIESAKLDPIAFPNRHSTQKETA